MFQDGRSVGLQCRKPRLTGLVIAVAFVALAVPAQAADSEKTAAKAHFEAATRLYDIHEYAKALEEYKAAYLAKPDPAFLFNVGQCYRRLGKFDQALEFYREYLKKAPSDDPNRPNVEARIRVAAASCPAEEVQAALGAAVTQLHDSRAVAWSIPSWAARPARLVESSPQAACVVRAVS
jgi:tetratricopeptide (TPR) repeat protein